MQEMNKLLVAGAGCTFVGWVLALVCCIIKGWAEIDESTLESNTGLWRICITVSNTETCLDIDEPDDWLEAVRALVIIGVILATVTLGLIAFMLVKTKMSGKSDSKMISFAILGVGIACFVIETIANIIYGSEVDEGISFDIKPSYTFALNVVASVFVLGGSILAFFSYKKE